MEYKKIGSYIRQVDERNAAGRTDNLLGLSVQKMFMPSIANTIGTDFTKYKVVKRGQFTYIPDTSRRGDKIAVALLRDCEQGLVSNVYTVFEVTDTNALDPEYLMLWFARPEFDRYARFHSHGSVREIFDWDSMCDVEIPFPPIDAQRKLVYDYKVISDRIALKRRINDNLLAISQCVFKSWFVDYEPFAGERPQFWCNGHIEDIADFLDAARKPLSSEERATKAKIYPYYGAVSIVDYVDDYLFDGEYVLLSEDGIYVVDDNGHPTLQHVSGKFWLNNHAHILKGKNGFNEGTLYLFLSNTNMAPIVTGAAQPKINQANLKAFPMIIPDYETLSEFNRIISPLFAQRLSNDSEISYLKSLNTLLLAQWVSENN